MFLTPFLLEHASCANMLQGCHCAIMYTSLCTLKCIVGTRNFLLLNSSSRYHFSWHSIICLVYIIKHNLKEEIKPILSSKILMLYHYMHRHLRFSEKHSFDRSLMHTYLRMDTKMHMCGIL